MADGSSMWTTSGDCLISYEAICCWWHRPVHTGQYSYPARDTSGAKGGKYGLMASLLNMSLNADYVKVLKLGNKGQVARPCQIIYIGICEITMPVSISSRKFPAPSVVTAFGRSESSFQEFEGMHIVNVNIGPAPPLNLNPKARHRPARWFLFASRE